MVALIQRPPEEEPIPRDCIFFETNQKNAEAHAERMGLREDLLALTELGAIKFFVGIQVGENKGHAELIFLSRMVGFPGWGYAKGRISVVQEFAATLKKINEEPPHATTPPDHTS